jgi:hypothetical protein
MMVRLSWRSCRYENHESRVSHVLFDTHYYLGFHSLVVHAGVGGEGDYIVRANLGKSTTSDVNLPTITDVDPLTLLDGCCEN